MPDAPRRPPPRLIADLPGARCVRAAGNRYALGHAQGVAQRAAIRRFLDDRVARVAAVLDRPVSLADLGPAIAAHRAVIAACLPDLTEEIGGLADGAGITADEAWLLQLRRELVGYRSVRARGDCTLIARRSSAATVLAQTIDLNGGMLPELTVLDLDPGEGGRRVLMVSFTGLTGYLGMNDRRLAIGINLVLGGRWRPGVPAYMAIRHLLDTADTVDDALDRLASLPLASSRALTLVDGRRLVTVEHILNEMVVLEGDALAHANHFLAPAFVERDEINPFARTSSLRRLDAARAVLAELPAAAPDACFEGLARPPVLVAPNGDVKRECTVGIVVMRPDLGEMHVRQPDLSPRGTALPPGSPLQE